jgi:DNA polymerase-1
VSRHLKQCFAAPDGWYFVQADYSQVEVRIIAQLSGDKNLINLYREGRDVYREVAAHVYGIPVDQVTKEQRNRNKPVVLGFMFSMEARGFVDYARDTFGMTYTVEEAATLRRYFFDLFPGLREFHDQQRRAAHTHGYVRSAIGRRRRLPDLDSDLGGKVAAAERQAINAPVQSLASDLMLSSLITLDRDPSPDLKVVGTVHDSLLAEVRAGQVREEVDRISRAMLYPPVKQWFGVDLTVPLEVEFLIGTSWGDTSPKVVVVKSQP